jgi:ribosomal protein L11 methyltransferase
VEPTHTGWRVVRVDVAEHLADALASFLEDEGVSALITEVHAPDAAAPPPGRALLEAHVEADRERPLVAGLTRWLDSLRTIEPAAADVRVATAPLPPVDWEAAFRLHHRPLVIGRRLLVAPPWDVPDAPDREVLVIEPGMAFGTGQHDTTRTCLEEIETAVAERQVRSALDVGTGSGVLAMALARLGVLRVVAFDLDAGVLPLARENLARNGAGAVLLAAGTVWAVRGRFDLVVANLLADALIDEASALAATVAPGGRLIVSGILDSQADTVAAASPLRVTATRAAGPWRTLRLER